MSDGSRVWASTIPKDSVWALVAGDDWVYDADSDPDAGVVRRLAASDGTVDWVYRGFNGFDLGFGLGLSPDNSVVYATGQGGDGPDTHAIDAETGSAIWTRDAIFTGRAIVASPDDAWVYAIGAGSNGGTIFRLSTSDGTMDWSYELGDPGVEFRSGGLSPDGGTVYAGDTDGIVHAIDSSDVSVVWTVNPSGVGPFVQAMTALSDGSSLVVGDRNGDVYGLDPTDGSTQWIREQSSTIQSLASFVSGITPPLRFEQRDDWEFVNNPNDPRITLGGQAPTTRQNSIRHSGQTYW